jgi:drug/metabolite transporter (DMT)-like permease
MPPLTHILLFIVGIVSGTLGAIFFKLAKPGVNALESTVSSFIQNIILNPYIFFGFVLYFIPGVIWIYLISKYPLSYIQPLLAVGYIVTPLAAMLFFHETVSPIRWLGIGIILIGVIIVSQSL